MFKIRSLFSVFFSKKNISKRMHTCGMVIISACFVVTVLIMGTKGFAVSGKNVNVQNIKELEDDTLETTAELDFVTEEEVENEVQISSQQVEEDAPVLSTEDNILNETSKTFRTATNNISKEQINLLSKTDYDALVKIVEAEATGEDMVGKIMVANVVLNRVESKRFPNTIYDVVHQKIDGKAQFSPIDDGRYYSVPIKSSTYEAVERALKGEDFSNGALFFVARSIASENAVNWFDSNLKKVAKHGTHEFFAYK